MSLIRQAFKGSLVVAAGNYLTYGFTILAQLWLVRLLAPEIYGAYAIVLVIVEITYVLVMVEFGTACIYDMDNEQIFNTAVVMAWIWSIGILLLLLMTYPVAKYLVNERTWAFVSILILAKCLYGVGAVYGTVLERDLHFGKLTYSRTFSKMLGLSFGIILANQGFGINSLLVIDLAYYLITAFLAIYISPLKVSISNFDKQLAKRLIKNSFSQFHFRLSGIVLYRSPVMLVQLLTGDKALVGIMDRAIYLAQLVNTLTSSFTSKIAFILFKRLQSTPDYLERNIKLMLWLMTRLLLPVLVMFILFSDSLVSLIYGEKWMPVAPLLVGLAVYSIIVTLYNILNQYFMSINRLSTITAYQLGMFVLVTATAFMLQSEEFRLDYLSWSWSTIFFVATISLMFSKHTRRFVGAEGIDSGLLISASTLSCLLLRYFSESTAEKVYFGILFAVLFIGYDYSRNSETWLKIIHIIVKDR